MKVDLRSCKLSREELELLARGREISGLKCAMKVVDVLLSQERAEIEQNPETSEDWRRDIRYRMGGVDRLKAVQDIPRLASELLARAGKEGDQP